ncbi:uncharacterized protein [Dysidea avara]|uniref:uncharacterized protein n=1 Tax=Dysidea avara TaxID=196820 RepID=UPI00332303E4
MEELTRLQASRKAFKGHVTRLHSKIDELMNSEFDDYTITSLTTAVEQIKKKGEKIAQVDEKIATLIEDATELEVAILDAEEFQDDIIDKITRAQRYIELTTAKKSQRSPSPPNTTPQSNPSNSQLESATAQQEDIHLTQSSTVESELVSTVTAFSDNRPSTVPSSTITPAVNSYVTTSNITETCSAQVIVPTLPMLPKIHNTNMGPPPLISAAPQYADSISPQRPITSTLFGPQNLYEPPINMQNQISAGSTSSAPRSVYEPFATVGHNLAASVTPMNHNAPSHQSQMFATSRLPKLTLPTFSGDPLTWQTFWDSFYVAIHANPNLCGIQKFSYLKAQLEGDAARTIAGLPLTDSNYNHAISLLEDCYGQNHKIILAHMQALLEMSSPSNNLTSLRFFYDSVESHIRGLSSPGKSEQSYGDLLIPIIMGKLSVDIQRNLAREHSNSPWNLPDLMAGIQKEIRILESGLYDPHKTMPKSTAAALHLGSPDQTGKKQVHSDSKRKQQCVFCKKAHSPHNCDVVTDCQKRFDIVKGSNLCFNCLAHHRVSQCPSKFRCRKCKKKHHTSLCNSEVKTKPDASNSDRMTSDATPTTTAGLLTPTSQAPENVNCLLKTAVAPIIAGNIKAQANILFDEGAQRSFISADMASELQITPTSTVDIGVASFGTTATSNQTLGIATVEVQTASGELIPISVLIVPSIAAPIQNLVSTAVYTMPHLQGLKLAHPVICGRNFTISLLIGTDFYWSFVEDHIVRGKGPTAQQSKLGYLLSGQLPTALFECTSSALLQLTSTMTTQELKVPNIEQFWSIEAVGTEANTSPDLTFLQQYQESSISQTSEGIYIAKFPWKVNKPDLPSNFATCKGRTLTLLNKLRKSPELLQLYDGIMKEQEQRGFIERVDNDTADNVHYLPHHPVKKDSVTTPIRIVYDCSCHGSGKSASLNDCLTVGPPFLNNLCAILLRFRIHAFTLSTDIEKAFLHIKLHPSDRDFTRFLWPSDPQSADNEFQSYRFTVVPFGASSSPFMLGAVLNLHLSKFPDEVAKDMRDNIYVDNILSGCSTEEELLTYYSQSRDLMNQAKFNLRSWSTNGKHLQEITRQDKTSDPNTTVGILGLRWNTATDMISLSARKLPAVNTYVTKRDVLQASSQIFDPLGWMTPVTVKAKILLQEIWQTKLTWDEPLPDTIKDRWTATLVELRELPNLLIPRLYFPHNHPGTQIDNIFVFADASTKAYGAVVYLSSNNRVCLAMSKNRVAPIRSTTLPRLELMAAVTATRLTEFVCSSIPQEKQLGVYFWTDSQIVLHWIHKGTNPKPFIAHRVNEICKAFPAATWSFTPSGDNPADLLTRGLSTDQLKSSTLWTQGPGWLLNRSAWPTWTPTSILHIQAEEASPSTPLVADTTESEPCILSIIDISRYSSINRLLAVTAYVLRFSNNLHKPQNKICGALSSSELAHARRHIIKGIQHMTYREELTYLLKKQSKCPTLVRQLRLFLDDNQLLRCGGRIHNAPTSELAKFPILLPINCSFTDLIVMDTHTKLHHGGVSITVTALRQVYWIPSARQYVRKLLRRCVICNKLMGKPFRAPDPPPLPKVRVSESPPFTVTGMDFTGALYIKDREEETKVYICIFTCAVTRAVHIEVVCDLSVQTFLLAFRRFSSRKSLPSTMISDNASTFLAAAEDLQRLFESETLQKELEQNNVTWRFIPKRAPWYGGFWERMVGLTKQAIKKTLGRAFVTLKQLETIVTEIEAMLNDRPLTYVSPDLSDPEPLTPSHLLYGRRIRQVPHVLNKPEEDPTYVNGSSMRDKVDKHSVVIQKFWNRWKTEYLTSLREFNKISGHNKEVIKVGDVVIVHDEKPRMQWRLAVVEGLIKGGDNLTRAAHIRMGNYKTTRPIVKLYPLEVSDPHQTSSQGSSNNNSQESHSVDKSSDRSASSSSQRVQRKAASKALRKISEWSTLLSRPPEDVGND